MCVILHMPFVLEQRSVCVKQATHNAPNWTIYFVCFCFPFVVVVFFFCSSLVLSPACFWTTWTSKVTVLEVYGSFWKGYFTLETGMTEPNICSSGFWTPSQRGMRCVSPRVCFFLFLFFWWGGSEGGWTPFFVVGEEGSAEAKWHSEAFVFGSVQSLLKWKQYVRGRQWHLLLASHGNRETDWRQRLLTVADIIKFHEETKPGWNALQNLRFQQKANSQTHDKTGTTMNALQTLSWKIISIIIWYVQLWSYKKAKTLSISFIQIIRKLKLRVCD